jgi:ubiquinone/menaquinone biosynthesis C-methylase UbiE
MLKNKKIKTKEEWADIFAEAKHGHVLWDGNAIDPTNPTHAFNTAQNFVAHSKHLGFFKEGDRILDLGCGNGRFAIAFSEMKVEYEGVEPMKECVDFCKKAFIDYDHIKFYHTPINSPEYGLYGETSMIDFKLDYTDHYFNNIICYSVFTHLKTLDIAKNYIKEIKRLLKKDGNLFITFYRSPPNKSADEFIGRTVYNEWDIMTMLNNFEIIYSYGGHTSEYYDQWGLFCRYCF